MFALFLVIIVAFFEKATSYNLLFKCCPLGSVLINDMDQLTCTNKTVENILGFNIKSDYLHNLPVKNLVCEKKYIKDIILNYDIEIINGLASSSCIDFMNNGSIMNIHVITCLQEKSTELKHIFKLKKCCPNKQSYNIEARKCELSKDIGKFDQLLSSVNNGAVGSFEIGLPVCRNEEVLVEYLSNVHKLNLRDNALIIISHNELDILPPQSFCIENRYNTEHDNGIESTTERNQMEWITFACRSKKICDFIPVKIAIILNGFFNLNTNILVYSSVFENVVQKVKG